MRRFILGTDWWTDCDDAVALRLLTSFVKRGDAQLLGVAINNQFQKHPDGIHEIVRRKYESRFYEEQIDRML